MAKQRYKYKIGDAVMVKSDLKHGDGYGLYVNRMMETFAGKIVHIKRHMGRFDDCSTYSICEDNGSYVWANDMFENIIEILNESDEIDVLFN